MLDSYGPYLIVYSSIQKKNFFQFMFCRYGIGHSLSKMICCYSGISFYLKVLILIDKYSNSKYGCFYMLKKVRTLFLRSQEDLDDSLFQKRQDALKLIKELRLLRSRNFNSMLPMRGQRSRTNARTRKKGKY